MSDIHKNDETQCLYVSSRGILKSCDIHSNTPISSIPTLIGYNFSKLKDNSVLYVCNSAIQYFSSIINDIPNRFVLVSGDSDVSCPTEMFHNNASFDTFVNNKKIIHWFTQNCVVQHSKVSLMPIGLDYHTLPDTVDHPWGKGITPVEQEIQLKQLRDNAPKFWERKIRCYSNFHFSMTTRFGNDRINAKENIEPELVFYEPTFVSREHSWKTQTDYAFVLSPHGNGLDCHRTWEALCLGCIVIVKTSPLDSLYSELPVLIVSDWADLTEELLESTVQSFKKRVFNYKKLTLDYWMEKIKEKTKENTTFNYTPRISMSNVIKSVTINI